VRNQDGRAPWSVVEDVTFSGNVLRHAASAINILGKDDNHPSQPVRRIAIRNNLFDDIGGPRWGGGGTLLQILKGPSQVVVEHNTSLNTGSIMMAEGEPGRDFVFQNNIVCHNEYGFAGADTAPGQRSLERFFPGAVVRRNVIVGGEPSAHPSDNFFPRSLDQVGFADRGKGDYRLTERAPYRGRGTDGADIGAPIAELMPVARAAASASSSPSLAADRGGRP